MSKKSMRDDLQSERAESIGLACDGIEYHAARMPGETVLVGFSVKLQGDCLITLRGVVAREKRVIAFVGGATLGTALMKVNDLMRAGAIVWKPDQFDK